MGPREAIEAIRAAGGVPVLAHFSRGTEPDARSSASSQEMGLAGLEVHYISFDRDTVELVGSVARRLGLLATGGSDYHGDTSTYAEAHAALHVPDVVRDRVRAAIAQRRATAGEGGGQAAGDDPDVGGPSSRSVG